MSAALVGAYDEGSGRGHCEIDSGHGRIGMEELVAQVSSGSVGEVGRVAVAVLCAYLAFEELTHFLPLDVYGRKDYVAGRPVHKLHDALSEVALYGLDAALLQVGGQAAFLCEHGFALDQMPDSVLLEDSVDYLVVLLGVLGPVYVYAVGRGIALEHLEVMGQMRDGMYLGAGRRLPQGLPFGDGPGHAVPFLADEPQGLVVPCGPILVGYELFGCFRMCAHKIGC